VEVLVRVGVRVEVDVTPVEVRDGVFVTPLPPHAAPFTLKLAGGAFVPL
jgi:hypothetical protein